MSVSKQQLQDFAKLVKGHPAFEEMMIRVQRTLFDRWLGADKKEMAEIRDISDNQKLFVNELNVIFESIDEDKSINDSDD